MAYGTIWTRSADTAAHGWRLLDRHSSIRIPDRTVKIPRVAVKAIAEMACDGSLLVIGEPGAGKSGCLHEFASNVFADGSGCVLMEAEHLDASSLSTLSRDIGISAGHTIVDVLANWPTSPDADGVQPRRYLVIDALDAARGQFSLRTLCDLVRQVQLQAPGWSIVASIREFDLKHGNDVQELFPGKPHAEFSASGFPRVRHVLVPRLTAIELPDGPTTTSGLTTILDSSGPELRALITNPFNLRLLLELISAGVPASDLAGVKVQVDLLDRYWEKRVGPDTDGTIERTVRLLIGAMKSRRELAVDLTTMSSLLNGLSSGLTQLQSWGVVRAEQRFPLPGAPVYLSFSHNLLFDYAAARVWLADFSSSVISELEAPGRSGSDSLREAKHHPRFQSAVASTAGFAAVPRRVLEARHCRRLFRPPFERTHYCGCSARLRVPSDWRHHVLVGSSRFNEAQRSWGSSATCGHGRPDPVRKSDEGWRRYWSRRSAMVTRGGRHIGADPIAVRAIRSASCCFPFSARNSPR